MPDAKLELLVRERGSEGFSIKEVPGSHAYASYRPAKIATEKYEQSENISPVDGEKYYVLKAYGSSDYVPLNEREFFIWSLMDGKRDVRDIMTELFYTFGSLDAGAVKDLIGRLKGAGLVKVVPSSRLRVAMESSQSSISRLLKFKDPDGWVTKVYDKGGFILVNRFMFVFYMVMSVLGIAVFGHYENIGKLPYSQFLKHPVISASAVIASVILITCVHELFHAMACKKFGRRVNGFGFALSDGFYPNVYTDVSDMYLASRKERFFVSLSGPLSTVALAAAMFIPVLVFSGQKWAELFYEMGRLNLLIGLMTIYPFQFLKMDGYYMLVDLLGFPNLRERSFAFLKNLPSHIKSGKPFARREGVMFFYLIFSFLSTVGFVVYFVC